VESTEIKSLKVSQHDMQEVEQAIQLVNFVLVFRLIEQFDSILKPFLKGVESTRGQICHERVPEHLHDILGISIGSLRQCTVLEVEVCALGAQKLQDQRSTQPWYLRLLQFGGES
jgi:hypothetical protein